MVQEEELEKRQEALLSALQVLTSRAHTLSYISDVQKRVNQLCDQIGLGSVSFVRTPSDYYSWQLEERKSYIGAPTTHHLCKSIILENTECTSPDSSDPLNSRYYCVIIQYTARLSSHKVLKYVRGLKQNQIPIKNFNFQLAKDSENLTGFEHNAVCPVGMKTPIPIIISDKIFTVDSPQYVWVGGGEVELKLGVHVSELKKLSSSVFVADITQEDESAHDDLDD